MSRVKAFAVRYRTSLPFIGFSALAIAITAVAFRGENTREHVNVLRPKVTKIVKATAACQPPVTKKRLPVCATRIETGLRICRRDPGCREAFGSVTLPPQPKKSARNLSPAGGTQESLPAPEGGDAVQPPHKGHQRPGPHHGGHHRTTAAPPAPAPPPAPTTEPEPSPGNSGETPAAEHSNGVHACVNVAVSACVKVETP